MPLITTINQATGKYFIVNNALFSLSKFNSIIEDKNDTIYEVIRIIDGKPLFIEDHIHRFLNPFHLNSDNNHIYTNLIINSVYALIKKNNLKSGNIRFQFANNNTSSFCAWLVPFHYPSEKQYKNGIQVETYNAQRIEPNIKARAIDFRAKVDSFINEHKIYEAVLLNPNGEITEGSRSNIFFIYNKTIITPPLSCVLPGITRLKIIELLHEHNFQLEEREIHIEEINNFSSCFISGTSPKILPIALFDDKQMNVNNPILLNICQLYNRQIDNYLGSFNWK